MISTRVLLAWLATLLFASSINAAPPPVVEIIACGQSLLGSGFLTTDLDCTGFAGDAITVRKGTVELAGFTVTAGLGHGIVCERKCSIDGGGGVIDGAAGDGIRNAGRRLTVSNLTISSSGRNGIGAPDAEPYEVKRSRVTMTDTVIADSAERGLNSRKASVSNSTISGSGIQGLYIARNVDIIDSEVTGSGHDGIYSEGKVFVDGCAVNGNGNTGIRGIRGVEVTASDASGNGHNGVASRKVAVALSTLNSNGMHGVSSHRRIEASDSTICGNVFGDIGPSPETKVRLDTTQCVGQPGCLPCP